MANLIPLDISTLRVGSLAHAVWLRLDTPLGSWWADPTLGSELYRLQRAKDVSSLRKRAVRYAEIALQPLLDDGRAKSVAVTVIDADPADLALRIDVVGADGVDQQFRYPVKVL